MNNHKPLLFIRKANLDDASLLAEIGARAFQEAFGPQNNPDDMSAYLKASFSTEIQRSELAKPDSIFFIVERDNIPVGYARLYDCTPPDFIKSDHPLELVRIYTLQPWTGQGIGGLLMQQCIDFAISHGYDAIWLSVWTKNPRAIAFYQRWGFGITGTAPFQLGNDRQVDYIMVKRLSLPAD